MQGHDMGRSGAAVAPEQPGPKAYVSSGAASRLLYMAQKCSAFDKLFFVAHSTL